MYKDICNGDWAIVIDSQFPTTETDKEAAIARAEARIGERKYNLIINNCENFARDVLVPRNGFSRQVMNLIVGVIGLVFWLLDRLVPRNGFSRQVMNLIVRVIGWFFGF